MSQYRGCLCDAEPRGYETPAPRFPEAVGKLPDERGSFKAPPASAGAERGRGAAQEGFDVGPAIGPLDVVGPAATMICMSL
jgi:hypothetical protein